jgi:hypothetical protein
MSHSCGDSPSTVEENERSGSEKTCPVLPNCHPERSEGSDGEAVVPSRARDLFHSRERSFVAALLRTADSSSLRSSE